MAAWIRSRYNLHTIIAPSSPVCHGCRKAIVSTVNAGTEGVNLLMTRAGSGSSCFKYDKAQTLGHLAPGCEDALSGLDPANSSRLRAKSKATPMRSAIGRRVGLCLHAVNPTIKIPIGRSTSPGYPQKNYVRRPRRMGNRVKGWLNLVVGSVLPIGGCCERLGWSYNQEGAWQHHNFREDRHMDNF